MIYKAKTDKLVIVVTALTILLFTSIVVMQYINLNGATAFAPNMTLILFLSILIPCYGFSPRAYELKPGELIIHRPFRNLRIKKENIQQVSLLSSVNIMSSIRTFGVGGLFGYYGRFYNASLGRMTWYLSRRDGVVLVETHKGKKILISPEDPAGFIEAYQK